MGASSNGRLRVLIVEDNELVAALTGELVQTFGHEVRVVNDGHAAIRATTEFHPQVILLDLSLPGMSGYEVAEQLRVPQHDHYLLVAVTGYDDDADRQRTQKTGFDRHLVKPIQPEMLDEVFAMAMERQAG